MSQRLQMVQTTVMAVICLAVLGLTWTVYSQNRALTEVNRAVLEQLTTMSGRPSAASQSPEWVHAKVRLVLGEPGGPPAVGFYGQLQGNLWGSTPAKLDQESDENGILDFGHVHIGQHHVRVVTPWGEDELPEITFQPGTADSIEIVCPPKPPAKVKVALDVTWPDDLQDKGLWLQADFFVSPRRFGTSVWKVSDERAVVIAPDGRMFDNGHDLTLRNWTVRNLQLLDSSGGEYKSHQELDWIGTEFLLVGLNVWTSPPHPAQPDTKQFRLVGSYEFELPFAASAHHGRFGIAGGGGFGRVSGIGGGGFGAGGFGGQMGFGGIGGASGISPVVGEILQSPNEAPKFTAQPGRLNRWKITFPDQFAEQIRGKLAAADQK